MVSVHHIDEARLQKEVNSIIQEMKTALAAPCTNDNCRKVYSALLRVEQNFVRLGKKYGDYIHSILEDPTEGNPSTYKIITLSFRMLEEVKSKMVYLEEEFGV